MTTYTENWTPEKQRESDVKWRKNNKEKFDQYQSNYRQQNRDKRTTQSAELFVSKRYNAVALLGGFCFVCGNDNMPKLVIHKKDCQDHRGIPAFKLAMETPEDFVLLCHSPCHKGVHFLFEKLDKPWSWVEKELGIEVVE